MYDLMITDDICREISITKNKNLKSSSYVHSYILDKELEDSYFYKILLASELKCNEYDVVYLKDTDYSIEATVIHVYDENMLLIEINEKLKEDLYKIEKFFNPAFILEKLAKAFQNAMRINTKVYEHLCNKDLSHGIKIKNLEGIASKLNSHQKYAIETSEKKEISFIWGPPGTGKTFSIAQIIHRAFLRQERVLVLSTSNVALDQIIKYIDKKIYDDELKYFKRWGKTNEDTALKFLKDKTKREKKDKNFIHFSTLATMVLKYNLLVLKRFDTIIIDEVSMVSLPYIFCAAALANRNIVLAGDYYQLPPISRSGCDSFKNSIYEYIGIKKLLREKSENLIQLKIQYRMMPTISTFISKNFYSNNLKCGLQVSSDKGTIYLIDTSRYKNYNKSYYSVTEKSFYNPISIGIVESLIEKQKNEDEILYLTPFRPQQILLSSYFRDKNRDFTKSLTVHRAQGTESDIVIFDFTYSPEFGSKKIPKLFEDRAIFNILNVAFSRAKRKIYVIFNKTFLRELAKLPNKKWYKFIKSMKDSGSVIRSKQLLYNMKKIKKHDCPKIALGINNDRKNHFLKEVRENKAKKKIYFSKDRFVPNKEGVTFRKIEYDRFPELYILNGSIILKIDSKFRSIHLELTSLILSKLSVGHKVDTEVEKSTDSFTIYCDHCGNNKDLYFDKMLKVYKLKCVGCYRTSFITYKNVKKLKHIYDIKCPHCHAEVIARKKKGRSTYSFWGCSNYPDCKGLVPFSKYANKL